MKKFTAVVLLLSLIASVVYVNGVDTIPDPTYDYTTITRLANDWTGALVLAPGERDKIGANSGGVPRSDYAYVGASNLNAATPSTSVFTGPTYISWVDESGELVYDHRVYVGSPWVNNNYLAYRVQEGSFVTIPVALGYNSTTYPLNEVNSYNFDIFKFETSSNGTDWTPTTDFTIKVKKTSDEYRYAEVQYTTIEVASGVNYVRVLFPNYTPTVANFVQYDSAGASFWWNHCTVFVLPGRAFSHYPFETEDNAALAAEVDDLIDAIGTVTFTVESKEKIDAARAAYNTLTSNIQAMVTKLDILLQAETNYNILNVNDLIAAIGTVELTSESENKITSARSAYDALSADAKALIIDIQILLDAEVIYAALGVDALISEIGTVELTVESESKINSARAAYDALSDSSKTFVTKYDVLVTAEESYALLDINYGISISEKEFVPANPSGTSFYGYEDRIVDIDGKFLVVRTVDGETITLQQVLDGIEYTGVTMNFYRDGDLLENSAKAESGIIMKANRNDESIYDEFTIQIYNYRTPTGEKKILKPGIIDIMSFELPGRIPVSNYATVLGELVGTTLNAPTLAWLCDNEKYPDSGQFWGQSNPSYYSIWWSGRVGNGLQYSVVPGSYFSIPLIFRGEYITHEKTKDHYDKLVFKISNDGEIWEDLPSENLNQFLEESGSYGILYNTCEITQDYRYIRVYLPDVLYNENWPGIGGAEWKQYGYALGMAKASFTPITPEDKGDILRGWYDEGELLSKNVVILDLEGVNAILKVEQGETMTLKDLMDLLEVRFGEVRFYDSADEEIIDLSTIVVDGQKIKALSLNNDFVQDGTIFAEYSILINSVDEISQPSISTQNEDITINHDNMTITYAFYSDEPAIYQDLIDSLETKYCILALVDDTGASFSNYEADIDGGVFIRLVSKDCPGLEDGVVTAEYEVVPAASVKEVKFLSLDDNIVVVDDDSRIVFIKEGTTYSEFMESVELQFAEIIIYDRDLNIITNVNTVITDEMSLDLILNITSIYYEFKYLSASENPNDSNNVGTGENSVLIWLIVMLVSTMAIMFFKEKNTLFRRSRI